MWGRAWIHLSTLACLLSLGTLAVPYFVKPPGDVTTYYTWGLLSSLLGGAFLLATLVTVVAVHGGRLEDRLGYGLALGFGGAAMVVTAVWAWTVRVDVFLATGWFLPLQRYILVGLTILVVAGVWLEILGQRDEEEFSS